LTLADISQKLRFASVFLRALCGKGFAFAFPITAITRDLGDLFLIRAYPRKSVV
jgi:hypothetical protein